MKTKQQTTAAKQARTVKYVMRDTNPDSFLECDDYELEAMDYLASLPVRAQYDSEEVYYV